jgi:hypothetical protein
MQKQEIGSRHRLFLTWIPLCNAGPALINQRRVILYGARARETPEGTVEREIRGEIRSVIPELFEGARSLTRGTYFLSYASQLWPKIPGTQHLVCWTPVRP